MSASAQASHVTLVLTGLTVRATLKPCIVMNMPTTLYLRLDHPGIHGMQIDDALSTYIVDGHLERIDDKLGAVRASLAAIFTMPEDNSSLSSAPSLEERSANCFAILTSVERLTDAETANKLLMTSFVMPMADQVHECILLYLEWAKCCELVNHLMSLYQAQAQGLVCAVCTASTGLSDRSMQVILTSGGGCYCRQHLSWAEQDNWHRWRLLNGLAMTSAAY